MAHVKMQEMHTVTFAIQTTSGTPGTFSRVGAGIDNVAEALNEVVQQYKFMTDEGFSRSRVTGMAPVWTLTGRRVFGDAAQDYIFAKKYSLGADRETAAKITYTADGYNYEITFDVTICNIQELSGKTEDASAISIEFHVAGKPTLSKTAVSP